MKSWFVFGIAATALVLSGCGTLRQAQGDTFPAQGGAGALAMTVAAPLHVNVHPDRGRSWMLPEAAGGKSILLYAGDWNTGDVYIFDYKSGKLVGTLTGFNEPYGGCVDAKGDVYFVDFGNGETVEYAHGGKTPLKTWSTPGYAIGCSVDSKNDLAVTDFYSNTGAGEIEVFPKGGSQGTSYSDSAACYYMWPAGYDDKGDLIVEGESSSIAVCELPAGASSMVKLSFSGTIDFPGGTMWDGKYIALGDQESGGAYETGLYQSTLSGSTLTEVSKTVLTDTCDGDYADIVSPFIVGKKNTPVNTKQGSSVTGGDLLCGQDENGIPVWHYPAGGDPFRSIGSGYQLGYNVVVSIGK